MASVVRRPAVGWLLVAGFVGLNMFTSVQFLLDSIKRDQIREIFRTDLVAHLDGKQIVVIDTTKRFNGKGSTYRDRDIQGLASQAGIVGLEVVKGQACSAGVVPQLMYIESEQSFIRAALMLDPQVSIRLVDCPVSE
jgi:hypothetical protein